MKRKMMIIARVLGASLCVVGLGLYVKAVAADCQTVIEGWCTMSQGQQCSCMGGGRGTWEKITEYDVERTLCSAYTPVCGSGPCNRLVKHFMRFAHWGCYQGDELCAAKHCVQSYNGNNVLNENCAGGSCSGPVTHHPVLPGL